MNQTNSDNQTKEKLLESISNNAKCLDVLAKQCIADLSFAKLLRSVLDTLRRCCHHINSLNSMHIPAMEQLLNSIVRMM